MGSGYTEKTCAKCWGNHRKCPAGSSAQPCSECNSQRGAKSSKSQPTKAEAFPSTAMENSWGSHKPPDSPPSIDTEESDTRVWHIVFTIKPTGRTVNIAFQTNGPPITSDKNLVALLDEQICRGFSADLRASQGPSTLIETAALAGGYARCLCSITEDDEYIERNTDGVLVSQGAENQVFRNEFKCFVFTRLGELQLEVMTAVRELYSGNMSSYFNVNAYSAAFILRYDLHYFAKGLRHKHLRDLVPARIPAEVPRWLASVAKELARYIELGCGQFPSWQTAISGALKDFKEMHRTKTTHTMTIHVQVNKYSATSMSQWLGMAQNQMLNAAEASHRLSLSSTGTAIPTAPTLERFEQFSNHQKHSNHPATSNLQFFEIPQNPSFDVSQASHHLLLSPTDTAIPTLSALQNFDQFLGDQEYHELLLSQNSNIQYFKPDYGNDQQYMNATKYLDPSKSWEIFEPQVPFASEPVGFEGFGQMSSGDFFAGTDFDPSSWNDAGMTSSDLEIDLPFSWSLHLDDL